MYRVENACGYSEVTEEDSFVFVLLAEKGGMRESGIIALLLADLLFQRLDVSFYACNSGLQSL